MPKETMSPRERWLAVLTRQTPDRVPMDYWATKEATEKLLKHLDCSHEEMLRRLHIDTPIWATPEYVGPRLEDDEDVWGMKYRLVDYGTGIYREVVTAPLGSYTSVEEIEANYRWPTADYWDYSNIPAQTKSDEDRPIMMVGSEPFLIYKKMRGGEQTFIDLIENPEIVHYCLDKLFDIAYENALRIFETIPGKVMVTEVSEDLGGQDGLMYSPALIREFFEPRMKRMIKLTKDHGSFVFHHDDGAIRDILPDMIACGIEILNPIQWRCTGMEREGLKRDFGDKLIFHGGVDNQQTLPFGTVEDVRQEVIDNLRILGAGGGYIMAPCHNIQAVGPAENVIAMYETGYECGWQ